MTHTAMGFLTAATITAIALAVSGCGDEPASDRSRAAAGVRGSGHEHVGGRTAPTNDHGGHRDDALGSPGADDSDEGRLAIAAAAPGDIRVTVALPGEIRVNGDHLAHVAPRVGGVAREVHASLGDSVRAGQLLALLSSRELADTKAAFLAAGERLRLAEATYDREERLWRKRVSAEQDYLDASAALAEARIALRTAEQKLHALGFGESWIGRLADEPDTEFTWYRLTAPFDGQVIDRHITIGESIPAESPVFTVADLDTVWVDLRVYQKDLGAVAAGQRVRFTAAGAGCTGEGTIAFVQPLLGEETRTALARVVIPNPDHQWKPGMFVSAEVLTDAVQVDVRVPRTAVIRMDDGDDVVFVRTAAGFEARQVGIGRTTPEHAEVVSGLEPGERYVAAGGFSLKAELGKDGFGDGHQH